MAPERRDRSGESAPATYRLRTGHRGAGRPRHRRQCCSSRRTASAPRPRRESRRSSCDRTSAAESCSATVRSDGRHASDSDEKDVLRRIAAHRAGRHLAAEQGDMGSARGAARSSCPAPPAAPPSAACTDPPRPGGSPGGAGGAGLPSAPTASPPPPWCTRPRAGPSRGGARDAPRDGNAARMPARRTPCGAAAHTVQGCRTPCRAAAPAGRGASTRRGVRRAVSVEPCRRRAPPAARSLAEARAG